MILSKEDQKKYFNTDIYTGSQIHSRFTYKIIRDNIHPCGNIFAFRSPMDVTTNLIDLEDVLNNDFIYSEDAANFIWEIPNVCPLGAVYFQRLFCTKIAHILGSAFIKKPIEVDGDDFMVHDNFIQRGIAQTKGKASVSITYSKDNICIGHLGINIKAGNKAPHFAYSTNLNDKDVNMFMTEVCLEFHSMTQNMWTAANKIIV